MAVTAVVSGPACAEGQGPRGRHLGAGTLALLAHTYLGIFVEGEHALLEFHGGFLELVLGLGVSVPQLPKQGARVVLETRRTHRL